MGVRFGGDFELGDRIERRGLHVAGAFGIVYLLLPEGFFVVVPKWVVLLATLVVVLTLEGLRHLRSWELPTIRAYEKQRVASFAFYAVALTVALLAFAPPIAAAVVLGTALIDPFLGELRARDPRTIVSAVPGGAAYFAIASGAFYAFGGWTGPGVVGLAAGAALIAVAAERPKWGMVDDDLAMTILPGVAVSLAVLAWPALTH